MTNPRLDDVNAERIEWNELATRKGKMACWDGPDYADFQKAHVDRIRDGLRDALRWRSVILDLGCGVGRITVPMARKSPFSTFVAVDISKEMLRKITRFPIIIPSLGDGRELPLTEGDRISGAYSMLLFQHLPAVAAYGYVGQVASFLRSGAPFVFQYVEGDNDAFLARDHREATVRVWCENAGLHVEKIETELAPGYEAWRWAYTRKP